MCKTLIIPKKVIDFSSSEYGTTYYAGSDEINKFIDKTNCIDKGIDSFQKNKNGEIVSIDKLSGYLIKHPIIVRSFHKNDYLYDEIVDRFINEVENNYNLIKYISRDFLNNDKVINHLIKIGRLDIVEKANSEIKEKYQKQINEFNKNYIMYYNNISDCIEEINFMENFYKNAVNNLNGDIFTAVKRIINEIGCYDCIKLIKKFDSEMDYNICSVTLGDLEIFKSGYSTDQFNVQKIIEDDDEFNYNRVIGVIYEDQLSKIRNRQDLLEIAITNGK